MKPFDLVIKGGEAILAGRGRTVCDIAIRDGKIAAILAPGETVPAQEEMPARGVVVMPGGVDVRKRRRRQEAASPPLFLI